MTDFVLVHGSGQSAVGWARLAAQLTARGHRVEIPELPKQVPGFTLVDHARLIGAAVPGPEAVVVAHSLSGVFLPLLPRVSDCRLLVYVAAVVPEPGRSVREQFTADPAMFRPDWIAAGPRWFDASALAELAREFLFHDCDAETIEWALTTVESYDTRQLVLEACPLARWPDVSTAVIVAARDKTLTPDWCRRAGGRLPDVELLEIDAGHCPHVSRPRELAGILHALASGEPR